MWRAEVALQRVATEMRLPSPDLARLSNPVRPSLATKQHTHAQVIGVREENAKRVAEPLVEVDGAVRRLGLEVGRRGAEAEGGGHAGLYERGGVKG